MNKFILPQWEVPTNVKSLITTRNGGVSKGEYNSWNMATHVDDNINYVMHNREILLQNLPSEPLWLKQTHSTNILNLIKDNLCISNKKGAWQQTLDLNIKEYDAVITNNIKEVAVIMTADCLPILITDKTGTFVGAIHAGWRGLSEGIIDKLLGQIDINKKNILVYIGPSICKNHFEVGGELYEKFIQLDKNNAQYFAKYNGTDKFWCDLSGITGLQLIKNGLLPENITHSKLCTYCEKDLFYSYRRDGITGRMASLIWLESI